MSKKSKKFTNYQLKALKPKPKRYVLFEDGGKGFGIRVEPTGRKTFFFEYRSDGRNRLYTIGPYPRTTLTQGRSAAAKLKEKVEEGKDPGGERKAKIRAHKGASTVEGLVEEYLERWAKPHKSEKSYKEDSRILSKDILPLWGRRKAKDITKRDIVLLLDQIVDRGAAVTANRTLACIRKMFNFAVDRDILGTSPCVRISAPTKEESRERVLSEEEIKILWAGLEPGSKVSMAPEMKLALRFMLVSAQRKGEVLNSEWAEFDLSEGWWKLPAEKTKNKKAHSVPLSPLALEILSEAKRNSNGSRWVFPSPVGANKKDSAKTPGLNPLTGPGIDHAIRRTLNTFGIEHFTPHDLRRTAASLITSLGIPRLTVAKLLNHADSEITATYDRHSYDPEKQDALLTLDGKLRKIIKGKKAKILPIKKAN